MKLSQSLTVTPFHDSGRSSSFSVAGKRNIGQLYAPLMLTSLVDAFSILVIYLLVNFSVTQNNLSAEEIKLPESSQIQTLESGLVIAVSQDSYIIDDKKVEVGDAVGLLASLEMLKKKKGSEFDDGQSEIILQADRNLKFEKLSPLLLAAAQVGFSNIRLAVVQGSEGENP